MPAIPSASPVCPCLFGTHAYAAVDAGSPGGRAALVVLRRQQQGWETIQRLAAESPQAGVLDREGRCLFVAHTRTEKRGVPAGRVETYRVDPGTGRLQLHAKEGLALGARQPLAMALAPAQDLLVVASAGGVFSLLPVLPDGTLQPVSAARKDLIAAEAGDGMTMQFLERGELAVSAGGITRTFLCDEDGMTPVGGAVTALEKAQATEPIVLGGLPALRCLAVAHAGGRQV